MGRGLEQTLAVLNGLVGDYLDRTHNGLMTEMTVRRAGAALPLEAAALAHALPDAQGRLVVLVHGLMCTEDVWRMPDGTDYGSRLEADFGYTALYVRYNTGRAIALNGAALCALLEALLAAYPRTVDELLLIGHSMGGLLIRSASHFACEGQRCAWIDHVKRSVYVGTPHLGAPSERLGKVVSEVLARIPNAYTQLIAEIAELRSAGVKDLGHADLRPDDRVIPRSPWSLRDARHPVPLLSLPGIEHHLIASTLLGSSGLAGMLGDALVPISSATFGAAEPHSPIEHGHIHMLPKIGHIALAHHPDVYAVLRSIVSGASNLSSASVVSSASSVPPIPISSAETES